MVEYFMPTKKTMTFEELKTELIAKFGEKNLRFNEQGKNGWTSVDDILAKKHGGKPGPRWCDIGHNPRTQWLIANYDFNTQIATFY